MRIPGINLFTNTKSISAITQNQQNPFVTNNTNNPFATGITTDVFQSSTLTNQQTNTLAQKAASFAGSINSSFVKLADRTKEFFAPAISFAGNIKAGINKLNEITVEDMFANLKKEISLIGLDKDVKRYVKMPVSDLRNELQKELAI